MVYHSILNIVLCAIQEDLVVYLFYLWKLTSANPNLPYHPSLIIPPLWQPLVCSVCLWLCFCFIGSFVSYFRFHIEIISYSMSFSFWLASLSMIISSCIQVDANGIILTFCMADTPLCTRATSSLPTHLAMHIQVVSVFWLLWIALSGF